MADLNPAKPGDKLTDKARLVLAQAMRMRPSDLGPIVVQSKDVEAENYDPYNGQWICIDCGELPQNQIAAHNHADLHPRHRFAWRNFSNGKLEEP